jgi:hypothetical protein
MENYSKSYANGAPGAGADSDNHLWPKQFAGDDANEGDAEAIDDYVHKNYFNVTKYY